MVQRPKRLPARNAVLRKTRTVGAGRSDKSKLVSAFFLSS